LFLSIFVAMKLENHIAQLLYRYQCVTVPEFGAFLTSKVSAEINVFNNTFSPPRKIISFNANLKNNDGLVANHIAQNEKINYQDAVLLMEQKVLEWKNTLVLGANIELNKIGKISSNQWGNLVFEPSNKTNFLTTSFGLTSYVSPVIKREVAAVLEEKTTESKVFEMETLATKRPNYLSYAAAFVIGIGTLGYVSRTIYNKQIVSENQVTQLEVQKQVQQKIQEATFVISNPLEQINAPVNEADKCFHIMAGSFKNNKNAERILKKLEAKGFEAKILNKNELGLTAVIYGSYPTFASAQEALEKIQTTENPDAWVLIKKF
jgi:hypothetical protein